VVAISLQDSIDTGPPLNPKSSLIWWSYHSRSGLIWVEEAAVAVSPVGAAGTWVPPEMVVAKASFDGPEFPLLLVATTTK
jgi:hypothetical protein